MPSRNTKEKPTISVTKNSSPEEIFSSSWRFINTVQFFDRFREYFELPKLSIEKLEQGLLLDKWDSSQTERESSVSSSTSQPEQALDNYLVQFLIQIIAPLLNQRLTLNVNNLDRHLSRLFPQYSTPFASLSILDKISLLKDIQDLHLRNLDDKFVSFKNEKSAEEMRVEPLGTDYQGWKYWYFGDTRLYREIPIPNGKRGQTIIDIDFTFQLVCSTEQEWQDIITAFQPCNRTGNKELCSKIIEIGSQVIHKLEAVKAAKARNEAKLKRSKELELIPKKRSSRLEVKQDIEAKRQKTLEIAKQQAELEEYERKHKLQMEKKLAEQERQELRVEEARLRNNVHEFISQIISSGQNKHDLTTLKELRTVLSKRASKQERLNRMQAWIKLLDWDVTLDENSGNLIKFRGSNLDQALDNILFKNTLRVYIATLMKSNTGNLESIYKKLVLNKYQHLDQFCSQLNLELCDEIMQQRALDLLRFVFQN
ncbi:hypothetical protein MFLAVUS_002896 [Mucor flavus]|uniref:Uncharacterized protein n=1 Tax=Mucor flavus TaxID=439312 RepID=A0ABP9YRI9_9FUNG